MSIGGIHGDCKPKAARPRFFNRRRICRACSVTSPRFLPSHAFRDLDDVVASTFAVDPWAVSPVRDPVGDAERKDPPLTAVADPATGS